MGGRFSVLSAVGLLPAAVAGIDINEVLDGAEDMARRCRTPVLKENPAGMSGHPPPPCRHRPGGPHPRSHALLGPAPVLCSLVPAALGRVPGEGPGPGGQEVNVGPTPLPALGATDQHSLLQLLMEGPRDKVVLFLGVGGVEDPVEIPPITAGVPGPELPWGAFPGGTAGHGAQVHHGGPPPAGAPQPSLEVQDLTPQALGELFMLFEIATVFAGALYGVDPLDQPGVELSKKLTYGLLGREGFERPEMGIGHS